MRIAVWHNLPSGGGKRALYYHIRGLVEKGHFVEVWCASTSDRTYLPLSELVKEHVLSVDILEPNKLMAWMPWLQEFHGDELRRARALDEHCQRCAEQINRGDFDVLFVNSSLIHAVSSIGRYVNTKKVLYLQEPNRWLYEAGENGLPWVAIPTASRTWMRPRYIRWYVFDLIRTQQLRVLVRDERLNASTFDRILVNSYFSRETLLRVYGLDSRVCYLGVDIDLFVNHGYSRDNFIVSVGALGRHKNVELVITAMSKIGPPRPRLVWIANACWEEYHEEMRNLAASRDVTFEARLNVSDTELVETLNRATAMVYAPCLEPFGLAPLEANACGLPVVAVAEGGVREAIRDGINGLLVENQPKAIARAIQQLTDDRELAVELGKNGSKIVREMWSVNAAVDRLEQQLTQAATSDASEF